MSQYEVLLSILVVAPDATPGDDYNPAPDPSIITFSDGDLDECISLIVVDDSVNELVEVFTLTVTAQDFQIFLPASSIAVQIIDNDNCEFTLVAISHLLGSMRSHW